MSDVLETTAAHIGSLRVGERAWFWFCPEILELPPLLLAPFRGDPMMRDVRAQLSGISAPAWAKPALGICLVEEDGTFTFGVPETRDDMLRWLASWVRESAPQYPELRRLYGARVVQVDDAFRALSVDADPSLWRGIEPSAAPGSLEDTLLRIGCMAPGESAWFWATDRGPGERPLLLVQPIAEDTTVQILNRRVEGALRRIPTLGTTTRGLIACTSDGGLRATASQASAPAVLRALGNAEPRLRWMLRPPAHQEEDLSAMCALLEGLTPGTALAAAFAASSRGRLAFLVEPDRETLRVALEARSIPREQATVGQLRLSRQGEGVGLRVRASSDQLLPGLARWVAGHITRWPTLQRLVGAHLVIDDGTTPVPHHEPRVWARLQG